MKDRLCRKALPIPDRLSYPISLNSEREKPVFIGGLPGRASDAHWDPARRANGAAAAGPAPLQWEWGWATCFLQPIAAHRCASPAAGNVGTEAACRL